MVLKVTLVIPVLSSNVAVGTQTHGAFDVVNVQVAGVPLVAPQAFLGTTCQ